MEETHYQRLKTLASSASNLTLHRFTPNLIAYLKKADLSISLGGYNTTMNILKTGIPALIYPANKDREQAIRAEKLEDLGLLKILSPEDLKPERLVLAIADCLAQPHPHQHPQLQLNGAQATSILLQNILQPTLTAV
ncbi:MAG: hypothetical protein HC790_08300 [Acaryochloridaceae cyanobacterium CSU_3_4]|nr:hypothetical protein [Acaryochloridaceae cyanobacterium CSU_3_4]